MNPQNWPFPHSIGVNNMKTYTVIASQLVYYRKTIEANSPEEAENLAWDEDCGDDWKDHAYGEWNLEDIKEA
jgi:hypothetical protein